MMVTTLVCRHGIHATAFLVQEMQETAARAAMCHNDTDA